MATTERHVFKSLWSFLRGNALPADRGAYVRFTLNGKQRKLALGTRTKKAAQQAHHQVERLIAAAKANQCIEPDTARWLAGFDSALHEKLVRLGLCQPRVPEDEPTVITVAVLVDRFKASKAKLAESSFDRMEMELNRLLEYLTPSMNIGEITPGKARDYEGWFGGRVKSEAGQRTTHRYAKQVFEYAVDHEWVQRNPFGKLKSTAPPSSRDFYLTTEDTERVLAAINRQYGEGTEDAIQLRLLFGLARYAGLCCSS